MVINNSLTVFGYVLPCLHELLRADFLEVVNHSLKHVFFLVNLHKYVRIVLLMQFSDEIHLLVRMLHLRAVLFLVLLNGHVSVDNLDMDVLNDLLQGVFVILLPLSIVLPISILHTKLALDAVHPCALESQYYDTYDKRLLREHVVYLNALGAEFDVHRVDLILHRLEHFFDLGLQLLDEQLSFRLKHILMQII